MKEIESWQNGKWIPNSKIGTQLWDAHYFFGWAVFDAFRTYNHIPHVLNCHLDRFLKSAKMTSIDCPLNKKQLTEKVVEVMEHNKDFFLEDEYRFMIFLSPGYFKIYNDMGKSEPILTINVTTTSRYANHIVPFLNDGFTAVIPHQKQIPARFLDPKIKSCSRLHYGLADTECATYGEGVLPILLDEHGFICESSGSNVGFVKDETLYLPKSKDMLQGCTMKYLTQKIKNSTAFHLDIVKDDLEPYDIVNSDFIIFTSTFLGLMSCYEIIYRNKKYKLNKEKGKEDMYWLNKVYSDGLGVDAESQWRDWYK